MKCTDEPCGGKAIGRGLCSKHYQRAQKAGTLPPLINKALGMTLEERLMSRSRVEGDCLVWTGARDEQGYGRIGWQGKVYLVSRMAFETFVRPLAPGELVRHSCDNPPCFRREHLLAGDHADNSKDAVDRDRVAKGVRVHGAKMTEDLVRQLRADREAGATHSALALKYGLSLGTINHIIHRKTWKHVA